MNSILFLCSGNYYRSRFAEIVFNAYAQQHSVDWRAESRGLALDSRNPGPISVYTLEHLRARGIDITRCDRMPLDVSEADFSSAHTVVAVKESEHRPLMLQRFPHWANRIEYWNVHDVDCAPPSDAIPGLEERVMLLFTRLTGIGDWSRSFQVDRA